MVETFVALGWRFLNAGLVIWAVLQNPEAKKAVRLVLGGAVTKLDEQRKERARHAAAIGIEVLKAAQLSLPHIFDNPSFTWDDVGLFILKSIEEAGRLDEASAAADHQLVRDYVLEALIKEDEAIAQHAVA